MLLAFLVFNYAIFSSGGGRSECRSGSGGAAAGGIAGNAGNDVPLALLRVGGGAVAAGAAAGGHAGPGRVGGLVLVGGGAGGSAVASAAAAGAAGRSGDGAPDGHGRHESPEHEPGMK